MDRKHRQLARRIKTWAEGTATPPETHQSFWQEVQALIDDCARSETEAEQQKQKAEGDLDRFQSTTADQLVEVQSEALALRDRCNRYEDAIEDLITIAQKDRSAGWKKDGNPDFDKVMLLDGLLMERRVRKMSAKKRQ